MAARTIRATTIATAQKPGSSRATAAAGTQVHGRAAQLGGCCCTTVGGWCLAVQGLHVAGSVLPQCLTLGSPLLPPHVAEYGRFFLNWYSGLLNQHADRLLGAARQVRRAVGMPAELLCCCACRRARALYVAAAGVKFELGFNGACLTSCLPLQVLSARCRPRTMREARELSDGGMLYVFEPSVQLGIKLAGVHWCAGHFWAVMVVHGRAAGRQACMQVPVPVATCRCLVEACRPAAI